MSYTDLAELAQAQPPRRPPITSLAQPQDQQAAGAPAPQPQAQDPTAPPDPRSFTLQPTNPASRAFQVASIGESVPPGGRDEAAIEAEQEKLNQDKNQPAVEDTYPSVTFPPDLYRPPAADRTADQWGKPWGPVQMAESYPGPGPTRDLPSPVGSYREIRDAGKAVATYGPPDAAEAASHASFLANPIASILDAISQGKFSRNFSIANLRALQIQQIEMAQQNQRAYELFENKLQQAGSIVWGSRPEQAERNLYEWSLANYPQLAEVIKARGLRGGEEFLKWGDAYYRRLLGAGAQIRKSVDVDRDQRELDALGGRPPSEAGGIFGDVGATPQRTAPEAPTTPTKEQEQPGGADNPYEDRIIKSLGLPPDIGRGVLTEARKHMNGEPRDNLMAVTPGGRADNYIGQAQNALQANIDRIAAAKPQPGEDPDQFAQKQLAAIRQNNPTTAQTVDDLKHLRIDSRTLQQAGGARARAVGLTAQIYPNWHQGMYDAFHNVWNKDSQESRQLEAGNRATTQAVILEAAINRLKIPEYSTIPENVWNELATNGVTSDPQFAALNEPLRAFAGEMIFLQTGRVNVTPVTQFLKEAPLYGGKAQLRTLVRQAMIGGLHTMEQKTGVFHRQTGLDGLPPATDPDAMEIYSEFARHNPNTGLFDKNAIPELKAIEPSAADRARRPSWRTPEQEFEPMSKDQWEGLRATIEKMRKDNPNDPRLPQLLHEFGIRE